MTNNLIDAHTLTREERKAAMPDSVKCWEFLSAFVEHKNDEGKRIFADMELVMQERGYEFRAVFREAK